MGGVGGLLAASFTALVGGILVVRFIRRWADRRPPAPRQPTFDQAELRDMLASGRITPAEFERLQALVLTQQAAAAAAEAEAPPRGHTWPTRSVFADSHGCPSRLLRYCAYQNRSILCPQ